MPTNPAAVHTLRQRGSLALGVVAVVACLGLLGFALLSGPVALTFVGAMLLVAAAGWVLFIRPCVVLTVDAVHVNNPIRRTTIPWALVEDVAARWNLEVHSGGRAYPAWAVVSHIRRPAGTSTSFGVGSSLSRKIEEDTAPLPGRGERTTVTSARDLVAGAREEWVEAVVEGRVPVPAGQRLTRQWDLPDIASLAVPAALLVVGLLA